MDLHSRKIIGHHFDQQMTTEIVEKALDEAVLSRSICSGLILHTDLGAQHTSNEYEEIARSMKTIQNQEYWEPIKETRS